MTPWLPSDLTCLDTKVSLVLIFLELICTERQITLGAAGNPGDRVQHPGTVENGVQLTGTPENGVQLSGNPENGVQLTRNLENGVQLPGTPQNGEQLPGTPQKGVQQPETPQNGVQLSGTPEAGCSGVLGGSAWQRVILAGRWCQLPQPSQPVHHDHTPSLMLTDTG